MSGKIINSSRYKKVSRTKIKKNRKLNNKNKNQYKISKSANNFNDMAKISNTLIQRKDDFDNIKDNTLKREKQQILKSKKNHSKLLKLVTCFLGIVLVIILSKFVFNYKNLEILSVFSEEDNNHVEGLVSDYAFNIGISKLDTTNYWNSQNIILNELAKKTQLSLVKMNKDYKLEYEIAQKVENISETSYLITLNSIYKIKSDDVINSYNKIKSIGNSNIYYSSVSNISKIEKIDDNSFKVSILKKDPFFVYKLNFPIESNSNKNIEFCIKNCDSNNFFISRNISKSTVVSINLKNYNDTDDMVSDFRNGNIDMFTASSDNIMQLIGKKEYSVKKYRDGETIFLLGNKQSTLFKKKEIRQALAYSINREDIIKKEDAKFSELIDIPYIYSDVKYKYDLYAAENVLLLNGWKKTGGIYNKNDGYEYKKIELNLLVNKDDTIKANIADSIKEMVEKIGIRIDVLKLTQKEINDKVSNGDYDLVLSTINITDNPDIEYIYNYVNVDDITNVAIENVKNSNVDNISDNLDVLKDTLSNEVACIGILAKTTNVVYQKYITGFNNIAYMKVFDDMENIGKISE